MQESMYLQALQDFKKARREAALQEILARITGKENQLLSYEDVRKKLHAREGSRTELREIPLDAIVGSVGRYTDFTRDFLPREEIDEHRWARIMKEVSGLKGLPPIEVYQIGDAYFVRDGNHRVSVARRLGTKMIEAYVTKVKTKVNITPDTNPDDLIIKVEYLEFLEKTKLDKLRPDAEIIFTNPGQYPILLEHITVHRYFMGLDQGREIEYEEAVKHWYDTVYMPVVQIIREQGILRYFPERTEADLYLWISRHQAELEESLEWRVTRDVAAADLIERFSPELSKRFSRLFSKIYDLVTPDPLEEGPPAGTWRHETEKYHHGDNLFSNLLVTVNQTDEELLSLQQAITIAQRESSRIQGLHIGEPGSDIADVLAASFERQVEQADVEGHLVIESGPVARVICERAFWTDLIISKLTYPPSDDPIGRLSSGFRTMIRRCPRPILVVPNRVTPMHHGLLAYNGAPKAEEALYVAAYLAAKWKIKLCVLIIEEEKLEVKKLKHRVQQYLRNHNADATIVIHKPGERAEIILDMAQQNGCDFILMGGYKAKPLVEVVLGSVVDDVLRKTTVPLLICR